METKDATRKVLVTIRLNKAIVRREPITLSLKHALSDAQAEKESKDDLSDAQAEKDCRLERSGDCTTSKRRRMSDPSPMVDVSHTHGSGSDVSSQTDKDARMAHVLQQEWQSEAVALSLMEEEINSRQRQQRAFIRLLQDVQRAADAESTFSFAGEPVAMLMLQAENFEDDAMANAPSPGSPKGVRVLSEQDAEALNRAAGDNPACAVCLGSFASKQQLQTLPCFHAFHASCSQPWIEKHRKCPLCRTVTV